MRLILIIVFWTSLTPYTSAQVAGKVFINGTAFTTSDELEHFDFKPLTAKLSKKGKKYLDVFATYYSTNQRPGDSLRIVIDPAQTPKEMKVVNNHIGLTRAWVAHDYLKEKYGIEIQRVAVREAVTVCVLQGTIATSAKRKKKRR